MWDIIDSNAQDGDKVKGAIAIDAFPGLGKTTAVMAFARKYHLREIAEKGRLTPDGHERLPVCRVGLTGNTSMKDLNRSLLEFYGHAGRHRGTTAQMAHRALNCVQSCHCRLLIIDDLHFLKWGRINGIEVSNHFKYIANESPVTLLFARISGLPVEAAPDFAATGEAYFRAETARFAAIRTPEFAAALDEIARSFLARHRVRGEPVTWHPPLSLLSDLDLAGPDPSFIDVTRLHELVRERANPVQHAAEVLATTVDAVRVVLDEHPAPAAPLTETQARATGGVRHAARQALTEKEFRRRRAGRRSRQRRGRPGARPG